MTRRTDTSLLASDCRAQFGHPSTRRGCRICGTVPLPVRPRGETKCWQANANTPLSVTPLLNLPCTLALTGFLCLLLFSHDFPGGRNYFCTFFDWERPDVGLAPTGVWRVPPIPHCNWRTLPSSQTPSLPALSFPLPPTPLGSFGGPGC